MNKALRRYQKIRDLRNDMVHRLSAFDPEKARKVLADREPLTEFGPLGDPDSDWPAGQQNLYKLCASLERMIEKLAQSQGIEDHLTKYDFRREMKAIRQAVRYRED